MFRLIIVSYCQLCRHLRLLAFVNIVNDNLMLSIYEFTDILIEYATGSGCGCGIAVKCQFAQRNALP